MNSRAGPGPSRPALSTNAASICAPPGGRPTVSAVVPDMPIRYHGAAAFECQQQAACCVAPAAVPAWAAAFSAAAGVPASASAAQQAEDASLLKTSESAFTT